MVQSAESYASSNVRNDKWGRGPEKVEIKEMQGACHNQGVGRKAPRQF